MNNVEHEKTQEAGAIRRLRSTPDFQLFLKRLERRLRDHDSHLRCAEGNQLYRIQGKAQEVAEILKLIETSAK